MKANNPVERPVPSGEPASGALAGWRPSRLVLAAGLAAAALLVALPPAAGLLAGRAPAPALVAPYTFEPPPSAEPGRHIAFLQERIRNDPKGGLDLAALAGAYLRQARSSGEPSWYLLAEQAARRSLANLPMSNPGAVLALAQVAASRHDFREALRLAERAAPEAPEDALGVIATARLALGDLQAALRAADRLAAMAPTSSALIQRALVLQALGRERDAIADLRQALAVEQPGETETSARTRATLARLHLRRGRVALATALYREATRVSPRSHAALAGLAESEARAGNLAEAEQHYREALALAPLPTYLLGLAEVQAGRGETAAAQATRAQAEAALRRDLASGGYGHRRELARLLLTRDGTAAREALALMEAEIRVRQDAESWATLAAARLAAGRLADAAGAIGWALRWGPADARTLALAGDIARRRGRAADARRFYQQASRFDPGAPEAGQARQALARFP